jgi:anti-sigma regulatory factor (Ser/Thr protein kinase)
MIESFHIESSLDGLTELVSHLERIAGLWKLSKGQLFEINLIIEEICMNSIEHGESGPDGLFGIELSLEQGSFSVTISDTGSEFDPTTVPDPDVHAPMEQRKTGGLGLHLVKHLADTIHYTRRDNTNILHIQTPLKAR